MRSRKIHFKQIPLEKVKMIIEKARQRRGKIKLAVNQKAAKRKRLNPEPPAK
jgi:hypothetical protein